jgi:hypothetical protein
MLLMQQLCACVYFKKEMIPQMKSRDFFEKYIDELSARQGAL